MRRILVTGSRYFDDAVAVEQALVRAAFGRHDVVIIHGDAPGADRLAKEAARIYGWAVESHPADWGRHGKAAGPLRNAEMAAAGADICVAFPLQHSRGTYDMIDKARKAGIPVRIYGGGRALQE
jgi:hypothetical protein